MNGSKSALTEWPMDIDTMRTAVNRLLDPDTAPGALAPSTQEIDTLTRQMRGHIALLAPEVEQTAREKLTPGSVARYTVLGCVGEAQSRLAANPASASGGTIGYARRLARVLNALCDHYERIGDTSKTPEQAALLRMSNHSAKCPVCRAIDDQGVNLNLDCAEGERLYDEYLKARRADRK